jgi:hypothetical protein
VHAVGQPEFTAVTAASATAAWAFDSSTAGPPIAWRLVDGHFTKAAFPGRAGASVLAAASSSADDVYAAAFNGGTTRIVRWNGRTWSVTGSVPVRLTDIVALSRRDAWGFFGDPNTAGKAGTWHYNGHHWSRVASGHGLYAGSAASAHSVWAVGRKTVAHWTGHTWSRTSVASLLPSGPLSFPFLTGVSVISHRDAWAVGTGGREDEGGPVVVLHYDGRHWSRAAHSDKFANPAIAQVTPDGAGGLWIPVPFSDGRPFTMVHFTGGRLRAAVLPVPGSRLAVAAIAEPPGLRMILGGGAEFKKNQPGVGQGAVLLRYTG